MNKFLSQIYSILFFLSISILTIIIVQTLYTFMQNELHFQTFIVSIFIELMFVFVIIKVYDELGCKWESVKTIPLLRKNKEFQTRVQNNYYYNNNSNTLETKTRFCSNCGIPINNYKINSNTENIPKFCSNCGFLLNENLIERNQHKEWPFHN